MATLNRFFKWFSNNTKSESRRQVGTHVKNAGLQKCPPDQRVTCAISLLQGSAYDWWKLVLRSPRLPDPISWEFFIQEFRAKYVSDNYRETKWMQFLNLVT